MSAIIYHVTVDKTGKENIFQVTWANKENIFHTFEQSTSAISPEEMEWMWKDRRNQLKIGEKLFHFLDGHDHYLQYALKDAEKHSENLQIHLTTCRETANWPFELLAQDGSFLLTKHVHLVRLIPVKESIKEMPTQSRHLKLLFMACSPLDVQNELAFEQEEDGILKAAENLAVDMDIEDTGSLAGLREKLEQQTYDIVHLSGYAGIDKKGQPFFAMESETGHCEEVPAAKLWHEGLKANPPRMLFLSGSTTGDAPGETENVFARILVEKYHIPAVLGWGQWISDTEANKAAEIIYKDLTRGKTLLDAVKRARYELHNFSKDIKPSWPQLRLFSNGGSLGAIVTEEQKTQPQARRMTHTYLRNSEIKVLAEGFVGRRRQLQQSIRTLKLDREKVGLLILGTGGLGKSCLAGKVSERFKEHTLISLHGKLNSISLKQALKDAFVISQDEHGKKVLTWEKEMKEIVGVLCRSCFKDRPYLILLDDFEQNLEGWSEGKPGGLLPEAAELLKALLDNLPDSKKMTRMIITSRYGFSLPQLSVHVSNVTEYNDREISKSFSGGQGGPHGVGSLLGFFKKAPLDKANLVNEKLELIWLPGFREVEQKKKVRELPHILKQTEPTIVDKLQAAGCGNPRLMEWLDVLVGELEKAKTGVTELLQAVGGKKQEFIQKHVINELLDLGGEELAVFLRWFAIYRRPVLKEGAKELGEKAGLKAWENLLYRGLDLSLVEHDEARLSYQGTPLLREEFLDKLDNTKECHKAAFTYYKREYGDKPDAPFECIIMEEWIYHALGCGEEESASEQGCFLIKYFQYRLAFLEAQRLGLWILDQKKQSLTTLHDASLLNVLGMTIANLGDHRKAIDYYQEALDTWKTIHGDTHQDIATVSNNLGASWQALGNHGKAIGYFQEALRINESILGRQHSRVAVLLNNIGTAFQESSNYYKAIDCFEKALTIDEALFGRQHSNVAGELNNLGLAWHELGDYRKSINYCQEALAIDKELLGWNHPRVARELDSLGSGWRVLGEPKKAIYYFQESLTIDEKIYGPQHPIVARDLNNLGGVWDELGNHQKAINCFEIALTIDEKLFGPQHPNIATRMINLGNSWRLLGEPKKALDYFEQALKIDDIVFGSEHPNVARDMNNLGLVCQDLGNYQKAIEYYQEALRIDEAAFGRKHANVAKNLNNQGTLWKNLGELKKALDYYQEALNIDEEIFGPQHPSAAIPLNNIGLVWKALKEPKKALAYFEQAMAIDEAVYGSNHTNIARHLNNIGSVWKDLGELKKAIAYFERALINWKSVYGEKHPHVAAGLSNLGLVWSTSGDYIKALDYLKQALQIDVEVFGREHPNAAIELNNLGLVYFYMGESEVAKVHFEQAYTIFNKFFGPEHPNTKNVAQCLAELGVKIL